MSDFGSDEYFNDLLYDLVCSKFKLGMTVDDVKGELRKKKTPEHIIKLHLDQYIKEFDEKQDEDVIRENNKRAEWYGGPNETPDSHWSKLKGILNQKPAWSSKIVESLDDSSTSVIRELSNPKFFPEDNLTNITRGLVLGYVQSGKTANYSAVISKALDAGYKFIIVLAGIHNNLRYQTEVRLREEIIQPSVLSSDPLTRSDKNGDFSRKETTSANKACGRENGFTIAVLKKNASVLRNFNKWLSEADEKYRHTCPVLLIDDESDQASINTSKEPELDQTAINKQIRKIISHFKTLSYVGYTATPFANILIDSTIDDNLFPKDFIITLKKPVAYTGAEELFGAVNNEGSLVGGLPLIREIPFTDSVYLSPSKRNEQKVYDDIPESLAKALDSFIISSAIRIVRGQFKSHISMLVHSSYKIQDQKQIHKLVEEYIWNQRYLHQQGNLEMKSRLEELLNEDHLAIIKEMESDDKNYSLETIWKNIGDFLEFCQVILDNSESDNRLSFESKFWGIVVGGNTLSRGLTIEGLTCSYFIRSSKMYDTLMQMGRWFGYRPGYLDLKRIFITDEIRDNFFEMASIENEIREEIKVMAENKDRPIDVRIRIRKHPGMLVTASNKGRTAQAVEFTFSGRRGLPDFLVLNNKDILKRNSIAIEHLLERIFKQDIPQQNELFSIFRKCLLYKGISRETILQFLDEFHISNANTQARSKYLSGYIDKQIRLTDWSIAIMSKVSGENTHIMPNGKEVQLLDRSVATEVRKKIDPEAEYIRGLFLPQDEMVDLKDLYPDVDDVSKILNEDGKKISASSIRRNKRPSNRALLAIYPLNPNSQTKPRKTSGHILKPLKALDVAYGIMLVFPEDDKDFIGNYIVNATV